MISIDSSLLIAAGASFVAGSLGYVIARLWVRPIVRYNITKRKLDHALKEYGSALDEAAAIGSKQPAATDNSLRTARQHGMELVSCYTADLPHWYRLLLESRKESPADASGLLTNLSKIRDRGQLDHRIAEVRNRLGLK
ncbi:conserved hypothetical protein [Desulfosarcina cetonica]|uniref:hypothetical protein n=1 Tax=Desulfosarcina cetonica TaxID=90730 RepID=UPI0006D23080|nr:hypothetical protein [Desulfosarcina cetonica]VTR64939.1 conserved hypothetical protein [Desulfosarcina cetonica]